jgi:hypothetical protein
MAKNNKPAEVYAKPHTMSGGSVDAQAAVTKKGNGVDEIRMSVGGVFKSQPDTKTDGITMRGYGAATKGIKSRGPMA